MKNLMILTALAACVAQATTYYWTGATDGTAMFTAGNWALEDGWTATSTPAAGDTVVFTNSAALSLTSGKQYPSMNWRFEGADVMGDRNQYNLDGGSSLQVVGSGTHKFDYTVYIKANAGDIPVTVDSGATMHLSSWGTTTLNAGARLVKRGAGTLKIGNFNWYGALALYKGQFYVGGSMAASGASVEMLGSESKEVYVYGNKNYTIDHYSEDADSLQKGVFSVYTSSTPTLTLKGDAAAVTRFSCDFYNNVGSGSYILAWDPGCASTLDIVGRVYNRSASSISVKSGTLRFSEGAGAKKLGALSVAAGATLAIADDASGDFSSTPLALATGATVAFPGAGRAITVKSVTIDGAAIADNIYMAGNCSWITGNGAVIVGAGAAAPRVGGRAVDRRRRNALD